MSALAERLVLGRGARVVARPRRLRRHRLAEGREERGALRPAFCDDQNLRGRKEGDDERLIRRHTRMAPFTPTHTSIHTHTQEPVRKRKTSEENATE